MALQNKIRSVILNVIGVLGLRKEDYLLSSYPRSGSTWIRFFLCNLISLKEWSGKKIDFAILNRTMIAFGRSNLLDSWSYSNIPRIVKTHRSYTRFFGDTISIGLVRDPRDVMVSCFHFYKHRGGHFEGTFSDFIRTKGYGLPSWFEHYRSWKDRWNIVVMYEDLRRDSFSEFSRILEFIHSTFPPEIIREAMKRSNINEVRRIEESENSVFIANEAKFARSGEVGQWRSYFNSEDEDYFEKLRAKYKLQLSSLGTS